MGLIDSLVSKWKSSNSDGANQLYDMLASEFAKIFYEENKALFDSNRIEYFNALRLQQELAWQKVKYRSKGLPPGKKQDL